MTREEFLKDTILKKYKSLRQFAFDVGIAPSTLTTILNSGIGGTSIDTMFNICDKLNISISNFNPNKNVSSDDDIGLNEAGMQKVKDYIEDLKNNPHYNRQDSSNMSTDIIEELKQDAIKTTTNTK